MSKIKWKNIIKFLILIFALSVVISDIITLIITMGGFTSFGILTFVLCFLVSDYIICDFKAEMNEVQYRPKHRKEKKKKKN